MQFEEFMLKLLTLCAAWTLSLAQHNTETNPWNQKVDTQPQVQPSSDDDFDPLDFEEAQNWLEKYNYFNGPRPLLLKRPTDMKFEIEAMQRFAHLPVTGKLDRTTMEKMRMPRCGMPDIDNRQALRKKRYEMSGQVWGRKSLTYSIKNYTPDLPRTTTRRVIQRAFKTWADVTPLTFREVNGVADIAILFAREQHGDGFEFDGPGGTLAHAYFPGSGIGGDAHFDDDEFFTDNSPRGTNFFLVAAHELGHSLGLAHSSEEPSLMAPYYQGYQPNFRLARDDIMGIQELYGKAPYRPPQTPTRPNRPSRPNTPNKPPMRTEQPPTQQPPWYPQHPQHPQHPARPEVPPKKPGQPPVGPGSCGANFQAAMNFDGRLYLFQGAQFWVIEETGKMARGYPRQITNQWPGAPTNIDAAVLMHHTENIAFFKGNEWFEFSGRRMRQNGTLADLGFPLTVTRLDAAIIWDRNSKAYFFEGNNYYRYNERFGRIDPGYPKLITPNWKNIPGFVDASFTFNGFSYFVRGRKYWKFDNQRVRAVGPPGDFAKDFMNCMAKLNFSRSGGNSIQTKYHLISVLFTVFLSITYLGVFDKYNYFHGPKPRNLMAPSDMIQAIKEYQDFNGLTRTGKLDPETMAKIKSPRCGVADFLGARKNAKMVRRRRYALAGQKWPNKALTYRILNYTPDLSRDHQRAAIKSALNTWAKVTPLTFTEITRGKADIDIKYARGEHGDGYPFDGRGGTLAHAYFPGRGIGGDAHFDDHEYFSHNSYRGTNLFLVAAHELGHSLGLAHSSNPKALMAPYYQGYQRNFKLPTDDIKGIQRLYGKAPPQKPTNPAPRPPSKPSQPNKPNEPNKPTTPNRPNTPNKPPKADPNSPCSVIFSAAMQFDGRVFLFSGDKYWRVEDNGQPSSGYPKKISSFWKNAPSHIDAALVMQKTENVVFFKGQNWYEYQGSRLLRHGKLNQLGFPASIKKVDSAVIWEGNSMPYLFIGQTYYRFNEDQGRVDQGYPKKITPNWVNIPGNIDATFGLQGHTYFLKGRSFYTFDDNAIRKVAGPEDFGAKFMKCTGQRNFNSQTGNAGVRAASATFVTFLISFGLSIFLLQ